MKYSFNNFSLVLMLSRFQRGTCDDSTAPSDAPSPVFNSFDITSNDASVLGFDDLNNSNEISLSFTAGSEIAAASVACKIYERKEDNQNQCDLDNEIGDEMGIEKEALVIESTSVTLPLDLDLSELVGLGSNIYEFDEDTNKKGTLKFCGRCVTSSGNVAIGYAETLLSVEIDQEQDIPQITIADVKEIDAELEDDLTANVDYSIEAYRCTNADQTSTDGTPANYPQGSYLEFCIKVTTEDVTCAWVEEADITSDATGAAPMNAIVQGQIQSSVLTSGSDKNAYVNGGSPSQGICYIKTQFPANLVPKEGTAQMAVTGKAVMEFKDDSTLTGRRFLRVDLSDLIDKKRGLKANDEDAADYTVITQVTASGAASTILAMIASFFSVAGCIILVL